MDKNELDFIPGIYKCKGNINHLRIRVRLEIVKSAVIPTSSIEEQETGIEHRNNEIEEREFSWLERIFSAEELKYYSNKENCHTTQDEEYYEKVTTIISNNIEIQNNRIHTSTSKYGAMQDVNTGILLTENGHEYLSENMKFLSILNRSIPSSSDTDRNEFQFHFTPNKNIVDYFPSEESKIQNRSFSPPCQIMHILVDVSDKASNNTENRIEGKSNDCVLATVKWNPKACTLSVVPDFSSFDTAGYKIELNTLNEARCEYRYWIKNVSDNTNSNVIMDRQPPCHVPNNQERIIQIPNEFLTPPKHVFSVYLFGELQKVTGFDYNRLFIKYFIQLPENWTSECQLTGVTHQSSYSYNQTAAFSHLIELKIESDFSNATEITLCSQTPQMFFEVNSLDEWGRYRVEGYAWTQLPLNPGCHCFVLNTWRPAPVTRTDELQRFFIGSNLQLSDPSYSGIPNTMEQSLLNRHGFQTISSGDIYLNFNVAVQIGVSDDALFDEKRTVSLYPNHYLSAGSIVNSISSILEAFKRARERMLLAKQPIIFHATGDDQLDR